MKLLMEKGKFIIEITIDICDIKFPKVSSQFQMHRNIKLSSGFINYTTLLRLEI